MMSSYSFTPLYRTFILAALVALASCVTAPENHGYTIGSGKRSFGIDSQFAATNFDGSNILFGQVRPDLRFGLSDTFDLGIVGSLYGEQVDKAAWARSNSLGVYGVWGIPVDKGSLAFSLGLDYFFGFDIGTGDNLFGSSTSDTNDFLNHWLIVRPRGSFAYSYDGGDLKPYVGLFYDIGYVGVYGGADFRIGKLKPSIGAGIYRPAFSTSNTTPPIVFTVDPSLTWVF